MLTYLRYALATICLALSVACLGLWVLTVTAKDVLGIRCRETQAETGIAADHGFASVWISGYPPSTQRLGWGFAAFDTDGPPWFANLVESEGRFGASDDTAYFPLWYAALVFALAGVAALRLGRRFTLRSAIIATTVVAGLLGMVVAL
jgi:hypothetical protein